MPGPIVHFSVANQLFKMFRVDLSLASPESRLAFLAGAIGPDLGYLSLFHTFLSDLVHYVDSGDFVSKMSLISDSEVEHAFVAGWASHCLVDNTMHPLINAAVGRTFSADKTPLTFAEQPAYHIRIETGLDASFRSTGELEAGVTDVWQQPKIMRLMHASYQETYNARFELDEFRLVAKRASRTLKLLNLRYRASYPQQCEGRLRVQFSSFLLKLVAGFTWPFRNRTSLGILHPIEPDQQLETEVNQSVPGIHRKFGQLVNCQFGKLQNLNLDTGKDQAQPYTLSAVCARRLKKFRAARPLS